MPRFEPFIASQRSERSGSRHAAPERRSPPRRVAAGRFDLHDVGAELAEQLAGEEAGLVA